MELRKTTLEFQKDVKSKKIEVLDITLQKLVAFVKNCSCLNDI